MTAKLTFDRNPCAREDDHSIEAALRKDYDQRGQAVVDALLQAGATAASYENRGLFPQNPLVTLPLADAERIVELLKMEA
jgi:hypothetical protein